MGLFKRQEKATRTEEKAPRKSGGFFSRSEAVNPKSENPIRTDPTPYKSSSSKESTLKRGVVFRKAADIFGGVEKAGNPILEKIGGPRGIGTIVGLGGGGVSFFAAYKVFIGETNEWLVGNTVGAVTSLELPATIVIGAGFIVVGILFLSVGYLLIKDHKKY